MFRVSSGISIFHPLSQQMRTTSGNCCNFIAHFTHSNGMGNAVGVVGGGFYCFKRQNGVAGFFILTSLCVFAILNIFLITSARTHTHTRTQRKRQSRTYSVTHTQAHTYGNTNISSQFAAASRQRTANKIIRQNVCGALYVYCLDRLGAVQWAGGRSKWGEVYMGARSHIHQVHMYIHIYRYI